MAQAGCYPWSCPMPHDHSSVTQGGRINNNDLFQGCSCRVYRNALQNINDITWTKVLFDTEDYDIGNDFDADGVDSNFIVPEDGYYYIFAQIMLDSLGDGKSAQLLIRNNGVQIVESYPPLAGGDGGASQLIASLFYLTAGDIITAWVWHDNGVVTRIDTGSDKTFVCIHKMGE